MVNGGTDQPLRIAAVRDVQSLRWIMGVLLVAVGVVAFSTGCAYASSTRPACADALLDDWTKGALEAAYPLDCYEAAIEALPEDLRAYTTAADDLGRAAIAASRKTATAQGERDRSRARQLVAASAENEGLRTVPQLVILLAAIGIVLGAGGLVAYAIRRQRTR